MRPCLAAALGLVALVAAQTASSAATDRGNEPKQVVIFESMTLPLLQNTTLWIKQQVKELGLREGPDVAYRVVNVESNADLVPAALESLIDERRPDLILTLGTLASRATRNLLSDTTIQQVFGLVADPISEGFAPRFGETSGTNISGRSHVLGAGVLLSQAARVLRKPDGAPFRIALLHSGYPSSLATMSDLMEASPRYPAVDLFPIRIDYLPEESELGTMVDEATARIEEHPTDFDGFWIATGPNAHNEDFYKGVAEETGLPLLYGHDLDAVRNGALLGLSSNDEAIGRAVGRMVANVLKGSHTAEMPVERITEFQAAFNLNTAVRLDVSIPSDLLELAGPNLFR